MSFAGYQVEPSSILTTNRLIHYRILSNAAGPITREFIWCNTNSVTVNVHGVIYATSAQDLTGTPAARLALSNANSQNIASSTLSEVETTFSTPYEIADATYFHGSAGTDSTGNWGMGYDDNNADDNSVESSNASESTFDDPADINGPNTDWDPGIYVEIEEAAGGATIEAESGSFAITGGDVDLLANRLISAESGSFSIAGGDADLFTNRLISAESGSFSIAGADADLLANRLLSAESGNFSVSGGDASLLANRLISAEIGIFTYIGGDLELSTDSTIYVTAEGGVFSLSGFDLSLLISRLIEAESGSFVFSGGDASLLLSRFLFAESGSFSLTGGDLELIYNLSLQLEPGVFAYIGENLTFVYSGDAVFPDIEPGNILFTSLTQQFSFNSLTQRFLLTNR